MTRKEWALTLIACVLGFMTPLPAMPPKQPCEYVDTECVLVDSGITHSCLLDGDTWRCEPRD